MSESPDVASVFGSSNTSPRAGGGGAAGAGAVGQQPPKRTRVLLSCAPCRVSKLKCDRESPCGNCLKKDRADLCAYAPRPPKPAKPPKGMAARLRRLEGLLREMMDDDDDGAASMSKFGEAGPGAHRPADPSSQSGGGGFPAAAPPGAGAEAGVLSSSVAGALAAHHSGAGAGTTAVAPPDDDRSSSSRVVGKGGRVVMGQRTTTYVGATHFMAVLDDIEDLKNYLEDPEDPTDDEAGAGGSGMADMSPEGDSPELMILGGKGARSKADLLAIMPARPMVDRLIMRYFASGTPSTHTLHRPTFAKDYSQFWQDPSKADMDFLTLLFIIMALGVHFTTFSGAQELQFDASSPQMAPAERYRLYRSAAACGLASTRFANPGLRMLQALLMFVETEFLINCTSQTNCFLLLAVCIRLMLKMGLHRDPSKLPTVSAFAGEMRRRMWNLAIQLDLLVSFHLGLPSMIHGIPSDTSLAHNLLDEDFGPDSPELPPARPDTEYTPMSYPIFKSMVCRVFGQVARLAHTLTPPTYAEVLRTDRLLEAKWARVPRFMKMRPLGDCVADPPMQTVQRFGLASLYQKSRCVLHRPYLAQAAAVPTRPEHAYSRRACLEAALTLLQYHEAIYEATQPGGLLHQIGWFITGLAMHDFLLAAMIVYLVVQNSAQFEAELLTAGDGGSGGSGGSTAVNGERRTGVSIIDGAAVAAGAGAGAGETPAVAAASTSTSASGRSSSADPAFASTAPAALPVPKRHLVMLLRRSYLIWADVAEKNPQARRGADLLAVMVKKIQAQEERENPGQSSFDDDVSWRWPLPRKKYAPAATPERDAPTQQQQQQQQQQQHPNSRFSVPPLGNVSLHGGVGLNHPLPLVDLNGRQISQAEGVQITFSRRDLIPRLSAPSGSSNNSDNNYNNNNSSHPAAAETTAPPQQTAAAPGQTFETWLPMSLESLDWDTVDNGLRVSTSGQETAWTDGSVMDDINYMAAGLWDHPDGALQ